jgi:hypothetical protein
MNDYIRPARIGTAAVLILIAAGLGVAASVDGKTKSTKNAARAKATPFTLPCSLPFKGVRHPAFDDRCGIAGGSTDPAKQAESRAKNNFCAAGQRVHPMTYKDFVDLQKRSGAIPKKLIDRSVVTKLGEGRYVSYIAFLEEAHYSDVGAGEAVNCNIPGRTTNDIHIVLVQRLHQDECLSTTAEISPHFRPAGWTDTKLKQAATGHPVRLSGQLFFDGSHSPCSGDSRPNPKRISVWEIHPVYSVEICSEKTIALCQGSAARWTRLSEL